MNCEFLLKAKIGLLVSGALLGLGGCGGEGAGVTAASPSMAASAGAVPAAQPALPPAGAIPFPGAAPAAPEYPTAGRACAENLDSVDELGALGVDCEAARAVAAAYDAKVLLLGDTPDEPMLVGDGWTCNKSQQQMEEYVYVSCDKGDKRMESVTFGWGT